jgi:uncharacterized surface protein with fasciclin (FAS1) repeats
MKKKNFNFRSRITLILFFSFIVALFSSCKDYMEGKLFQTSDQIMIDEYLQKDTSMTEFLKIADIAGFRGLLHAYGTNTCFAPTNTAIKAYCKKLGISTMETLPVADLEKFMKFHLVRDTIHTADLVDGRLATATMLGKYLTSKTVINSDLQPVLQINRQATVITKDINLGNGILDRIDNVLIPNPLTVGEMIDQLPDNYSLFKSIMKETGLTDTLTLNKADNQWYTVFLQSNESFATEGVTDLLTLIQKMEIAQPDYKDNPAKLEELYAQYHCVRQLSYVADLCQTSTEITMATNQVISFKVSKDSLIVNEFKSLTQFEKGVVVDKLSNWTDMSCYNGVLIDLQGYIQPVKRGPVAVYWEWTDQPEIRQMGLFRKKGAGFNFKPGDLANIQFGGINGPLLEYGVGVDYSSNSNQYVNNDYFWVQLRANVVQWIEIKTPVLTEGAYYVWVAYRRGGSSLKFKTTFKEAGYDDQLLPNVIDLGDYFPYGNNPDVNLANGWKQYNAKYASGVYDCRNSGAIKVDYTGQHILRWDAIGNGSSGAQIDMIQFIPVDQNQIWPRFDINGTAIYPGTPCNQIAPFDQKCYGDLSN